MILDLRRKNTYSEELWNLIVRVNNLTKGTYSSWADNARTLTRLMERIIVLSRKECAWEVYFNTILMLFYLVCRDDVMNTKEAFKLAELYHHDYPLYMDQAMAEDSGTGHLSYCICTHIVEFYQSYPQITDEKMDQMLKLFYENDSRYGVKYNTCNYRVILRLGIFNHDSDMVRRARMKLEATDYTYNCYICFYAKQIIGYYIYNDDYDGMLEIIQRICEKSIPDRYKWCYEKCEDRDETDLVSIALDDCLKQGRDNLFLRLFSEKIHIYRQPDMDIKLTHVAVFHALAGDWSILDKSLRLAETDNRKRQQNEQTPLGSLYDALYWTCFFQLLDNRGIHTVSLAIDDSSPESREEESVWASLEAAAYFERQADLTGTRMEASRKRFQYESVKQTFQKCLFHNWYDRKK